MVWHSRTAVSRGFELDLGLRPGLDDENAVAVALGNLAASELQRARNEPLEWKIVRVEEVGGRHHFAILVRHPKRLIDAGIHPQLRRILETLSTLSETELQSRFDRARSQGLQPIPLTHTEEQIDFWVDKDWTLWWVGSAAGVVR